MAEGQQHNDMAVEMALTKKDIQGLYEATARTEQAVKELAAKFESTMSNMDDRYTKRRDFDEYKKEQETKIETLTIRVTRYQTAIWSGAVMLIIGLGAALLGIRTFGG
jgi:phosphoenolpyruvate-protein kinase (PTS system EI component)